MLRNCSPYGISREKRGNKWCFVARTAHERAEQKGTRRAATGVVLRGVHHVCQDLFYPKYSYKAATQGPTPPEYLEGISRGQPASRSNARTSRGGMRRGVRVDTELGHIARLLRLYGNQHRVTLNTFLKPSSHVSTSIPTKDRRKLLQLRGRLHPFTKAVVHQLQASQWLPYMGQVNVGSAPLRVGTAIDLLCYDVRRRAWVVIELKCGFDKYYTKHTKHNMEPPFETLDDSCQQQHQVQLLLTTWLFQKQFRAPVSEAVVMRAHRHGVAVYRLNPRLQTSKVLDAVAAKLKHRR